jgi:alternative squalene epoxidase
MASAQSPPPPPEQENGGGGGGEPSSSSSKTFNRTQPLWLSPVGTLSSYGVWPMMVSLPLALTLDRSPLHYAKIFPPHWYQSNGSAWPKPLGLSLGIAAVAVGQIGTTAFFYLYKHQYFYNETRSIQTKGAEPYEFREGIITHYSQPEGFGLLVGYLCLTWMCNLLPPSYYSFTGGIQWTETFLCLVLQDLFQYIMHRLEHDLSPAFYQLSHKPHHRFTNPRLFDAFNGSLLDTFFMIIIPLYATALTVRTANVWSYMAFGSTYSCWLTLIHSECAFPWDGIFRRFGLGTPADHHVHHK